MYGHRILDPQRVLSLKRQGFANAEIARRLGVTTSAIYHVLKKINAALSTETVDKAVSTYKRHIAKC